MGVLISIFGPLLHVPLVAPALGYGNHHLWSQATTSVMVKLNSYGKDVVHVVPSITLQVPLSPKLHCVAMCLIPLFLQIHAHNITFDMHVIIMYYSDTINGCSK
jgi:hypothetical protein